MRIIHASPRQQIPWGDAVRLLANLACDEAQRDVAAYTKQRAAILWRRCRTIPPLSVPAWIPSSAGLAACAVVVDVDADLGPLGAGARNCRGKSTRIFVRRQSSASASLFHAQSRRPAVSPVEIGPQLSSRLINLRNVRIYLCILWNDFTALRDDRVRWSVISSIVVLGRNDIKPQIRFEN